MSQRPSTHPLASHGASAGPDAVPSPARADASSGPDVEAAARQAPAGAAPVRRRTPREGRLVEILSNEKSFKHRWIGSVRANRWGLHPARVAVAAVCGGVRRSLAPGREPALAATLARDGLVILENALPPEVFEAARAEFAEALARHAVRVPRPPCNTRGFGAPLPNDWGFDRYDGGSLNRFVRLGAGPGEGRGAAAQAFDDHPALREAFGDASPLAARLRPLCGTRVSLDRFQLYQLVHGGEGDRPDLQRKVHSDTFHETFKLWYFFDAVGLEDGPLMYARGSHRNTPARLAWERRCMLDGRSSSSAFRIEPDELRALGWSAPTPVLAPANALVLANTRGFHCRGVAPAGTERDSVYANLRPAAFGLQPR